MVNPPDWQHINCLSAADQIYIGQVLRLDGKISDRYTTSNPLPLKSIYIIWTKYWFL